MFTIKSTLLDSLALYRQYADTVGCVPIELLASILELEHKAETVLRTAGVDVLPLDGKLWVPCEAVTNAIRARLNQPLPNSQKTLMRRHRGDLDFAPGWQDLQWWKYIQVQKWASCSRKHVERAILAGKITKYMREGNVAFNSAEIKEWATPKAVKVAAQLPLESVT